MSADIATDDELAELFSLDSADELPRIASGKGGKLFIDTCDGQWMKYESSKTWRFIQAGEDAA